MGWADEFLAQMHRQALEIPSNGLRRMTDPAYEIPSPPLRGPHPNAIAEHRAVKPTDLPAKRRGRAGAAQRGVRGGRTSETCRAALPSVHQGAPAAPSGPRRAARARATARVATTRPKKVAATPHRHHSLREERRCTGKREKNGDHGLQSQQYVRDVTACLRTRRGMLTGVLFMDSQLNRRAKAQLDHSLPPAYPST